MSMRAMKIVMSTSCFLLFSCSFSSCPSVSLRSPARFSLIFSILLASVQSRACFALPPRRSSSSLVSYFALSLTATRAGDGRRQTHKPGGRTRCPTASVRRLSCLLALRAHIAAGREQERSSSLHHTNQHNYNKTPTRREWRAGPSLPRSTSYRPPCRVSPPAP